MVSAYHFIVDGGHLALEHMRADMDDNEDAAKFAFFSEFTGAKEMGRYSWQPNKTSILQTLDKWMSRTFKRHY